MNCALKVNNVSKKAKDFQILHNVSFELEKGEIVGLIGPNGAGKTSIMKILVGLTRNYTGEVDLTAVKDIGCMIETPNFYPYSTGYQNLMYFAGLNGVGKQKVEELLKLLGLWDAAHKNVKTYSLGMRQRLGIAQALLKNPDVLVLDEPTNGLDPAGIQEMRELIRSLPEKYGMTVIISSHLLSEIDQIVDDIGIIANGKLKYQGSLGRLHEQDTTKTLEEIFLDMTMEEVSL